MNVQRPPDPALLGNSRGLGLGSANRPAAWQQSPRRRGRWQRVGEYSRRARAMFAGYGGEGHTDDQARAKPGQPRGERVVGTAPSAAARLPPLVVIPVTVALPVSGACRRPDLHPRRRRQQHSIRAPTADAHVSQPPPFKPLLACVSAGAGGGAGAAPAGSFASSSSPPSLPPLPPSNIKVYEAGRQASGKRVVAEMVVQAPVDIVWRVLTNYERLAEFVPNLESCERLLSPNKNKVGA